MKINPIRSAGVIVNYQCSAACRHCCYSSSPRWPKDYMDEDTAARIAQTLKKHRCHSCHIGGGEPFLNIEKLIGVCKVFQKEGIAIEYIETNCSWHINDELSKEILHKLMAAGVDCLLISADPFHNEFIPYDKTLGAIRLCRSIDMGTFVWPGRFDGELKALDTAKTHTLDEYAQQFDINYTVHAVARYGLTPNGRALNLYQEVLPFQSAEEIVGAAGPCRNLTQTGHCHLDLYQNFIPPGCTGLKLPIDELDLNIDPRKYPLITTLFEHGIKGLLHSAGSLGFTPASKGYVHQCHLCMDLKKFMLNVHPSKDLGYTYFFAESV